MATTQYETITPVVPAAANETTIADAQWGIDNLLPSSTGVWIIQSETITSELVTDTTQDQKGRVIGQLDYDKHYTCSLDVIGNGILPTMGDTTLEYADKKWKVQSITYNGSYQDKKKYTIALERWEHFPQQAAQSQQQAGG